MKYLFAVNSHPQHTFALWLDEFLQDMLGSSYQLTDVYDFYGDLSHAHALHAHHSSNYAKVEYFSKQDLSQLNKALVSRLREQQWDYLLIGGASHLAYFLFPDTLVPFCDDGKLVFSSVGDDETADNFERNRYLLFLFNGVHVRLKTFVAKYEKHHPNIFHMPVGLPAVPQISAQSKDIDVIFIGRPYGSRIRVLKYLAKHRPHLNLHIYGPDDWRVSRRLTTSYRGFLEVNDFYRRIGRSRISLCLMEGFDDKPHINAKVFDSCLGDVLPLCTYYEPFVEEYGFRDKHNIVFYGNYRDIPELVDYYLQNDAERLDIARRARENLTRFSNETIYRNYFRELNARIHSQSPRSSLPIRSVKANAIKIAFVRVRGSTITITRCSTTQELAASDDLDAALAEYAYVVHQKDGVAVVRFFEDFFNAFHHHDLLSRINITWKAAPGLVINYKIPVTFDAVVYEREFFCKHLRTITRGSAFRKYMLFLANQSRIRVIPLIFFISGAPERGFARMAIRVTRILRLVRDRRLVTKIT